MKPGISKSRLILFAQFSLLTAFVAVAVLSGQRAMFRGDRLVGVVLLLAGSAVLASAAAAYRNTMGTLRVKVVPDPAEHGGLITRGIYSRIRHPFYAAVPLVLAGAMLVLRKPWCAVVILGSFPLLYWKSSYEEQLLEKKFPEYPAYRKRTGRFFPRLGG